MPKELRLWIIGSVFELQPTIDANGDTVYMDVSPQTVFDTWEEGDEWLSVEPRDKKRLAMFWHCAKCEHPLGGRMCDECCREIEENK